MTEERLIHGSYGEQRYLHSYEIFCKERNYKIIEKYFIANNKYCYILPNLFAQQAIFVITK